MIGDHGVIHARCVQRITQQVHDRTIAGAVGRDVGMPVHVAAIDMISLAAGAKFVPAYRLHLGLFLGMYRRHRRHLRPQENEIPRRSLWTGLDCRSIERGGINLVILRYRAEPLQSAGGKIGRCRRGL